MTNHWNQSRSNFRTGEPVDHLRAKDFIGTLLHQSGWDVQYEYPLVDSLVDKYHHNYDIVAIKKMVIVEIDDPNLHSKPRKRANDLIASNHALQKFPHAKFLRLDKYEVNAEPDIMTEYLNEYFWPFIK